MANPAEPSNQNQKKSAPIVPDPTGGAHRNQGSQHNLPREIPSETPTQQHCQTQAAQIQQLYQRVDTLADRMQQMQQLNEQNRKQEYKQLAGLLTHQLGPPTYPQTLTHMDHENTGQMQRKKNNPRNIRRKTKTKKQGNATDAGERENNSTDDEEHKHDPVYKRNKAFREIKQVRAKMFDGSDTSEYKKWKETLKQDVDDLDLTPAQWLELMEARTQGTPLKLIKAKAILKNN